MRIVRGVLGVFTGYAAVVLVTEFGFRLLPRNPVHNERLLIVFLGGVVAVVAGLAGGSLASWIARSRVAGALILLPLIAETIWLLFFRVSAQRTDWRDAAAALTLLAAVATGAYFARKTTSPPTTV